MAKLRLSNPLTEPIGADRPDYSGQQKKGPPTNTTAKLKADPSSIEDLANYFGYDDQSGRVYWLRNPVRGPRKIGTYAGTPYASGHRFVKFKGAILMESHVVWALTHGEWPIGRLNHRDEDKDNTRVDNLIPQSECDNPSGLPPGVKKHENGQFKAYIFRKKLHYLGIYDTAEEAHAQYQAAKKLVHNPSNWSVDPEIMLKGLMIDYKNRAKSLKT
ncbi:putative endonuclease [Achromobacter phage JWF]|uniref:putative endonuclease n=1 Tax=Achromobacter phage JWF TaxID=1589748 RepID=UPI000588E7BD|nr:putative endonuclease [Achromobacter phage JWF]AJD82897.1 putative endonuclease [Achromobacter phage JWF]